jgi:hypothetical protein
VRFACVLSLVLVMLAGGCLSGKKMSDIGTPSATPAQSPGATWSIPPGVSVPASRRGAPNIDGLYASFVAGDKMCCWIGTRARVRTLKLAPATQLDLTIYVPDYPFFTKHKQGLAVTIDGSRTQTRCCFGPGVYTLSFELPPSLQQRRGEIALELSTTESFVPLRERINADDRSLGVVLSRVDYLP